MFTIIEQRPIPLEADKPMFLSTGIINPDFNKVFLNSPSIPYIQSEYKSLG